MSSIDGVRTCNAGKAKSENCGLKRAETVSLEDNSLQPALSSLQIAIQGGKHSQIDRSDTERLRSSLGPVIFSYRLVVLRIGIQSLARALVARYKWIALHVESRLCGAGLQSTKPGSGSQDAIV